MTGEILLPNKFLLRNNHLQSSTLFILKKAVEHLLCIKVSKMNSVNQYPNFNQCLYKIKFCEPKERKCSNQEDNIIVLTI